MFRGLRYGIRNFLPKESTGEKSNLSVGKKSARPSGLAE